jgi:hypothetical protein
MNILVSVVQLGRVHHCLGNRALPDWLLLRQVLVVALEALGNWLQVGSIVLDVVLRVISLRVWCTTPRSAVEAAGPTAVQSGDRGTVPASACSGSVVEMTRPGKSRALDWIMAFRSGMINWLVLLLWLQSYCTAVGLHLPVLRRSSGAPPLPWLSEVG